MTETPIDLKTADAFATSWNNLPLGSVYTYAQFIDWMLPLEETDVSNRRVLELGCGNGSLLVHTASWKPSSLLGVDLGESVISAKKNLSQTPFSNWKVIKGDLTTFEGEGFDIVYCIGVLHHLKKPKEGFDSMVRNTIPGGKFHGWVYAREGNALIIWIVDPIRKLASKLPWWITKYFIATPLVVPFYFYSKILRALPRFEWLDALPLYKYSLWIGEREFDFYRHVAFDQLVTPQTAYISRATIEQWLSDSRIDRESAYIIMRNGNSWKFGGRKINDK